MRVLVGVLVALLVVVVATSAWVRLAQSGLSCEGAPDCYATKAARTAAERSASVAVARTLHRIAASAAGAVVVALLFVGWRRSSSGERAAMIVLVLLALGLATLGQYTPSTLPAVTLGNLLGGMTMIGVAVGLGTALRNRAPAVGERALRRGAVLAIVLVATQVAAGGMISARHAAFACAGFPLCDGRAWRAGVSAVFDPMHETAPPASAIQRADPARQAVMLAHRLLAVPTLLLLAWLGVRATRAGAATPGRALFAFCIVQLALGAWQALAGPPLAVAVAHNLAAVGVVMALAALAARGRPA